MAINSSAAEAEADSLILLMKLAVIVAVNNVVLPPLLVIRKKDGATSKFGFLPRERTPMRSLLLQTIAAATLKSISRAVLLLLLTSATALAGDKNLGNGMKCTASSECASGSCSSGVCWSGSIYRKDLANSVKCTANSDCKSGRCLSGVCRQ